MATCEREPVEGYSFRGKKRRLDEEVLKISICKQQFKRWCNFKIKVKCTRDSEGIQILLDHWYRTFPDTSLETENGAKRKGRETRPMSKAGNGTLPDTETQNSEDEDCVTCTGLSPTEHVQTEVDSIPLKMEVDDDIVTEEPENTEIERVLSPSVMVTEDNLNKEIKKEKLWTQKFCFLSNCNQRVVPRHAEVKKLNEADLGNKVVNFTIDENPSTFRESIFSACPQLRVAGGFELFRRKSTFRLENISEPPDGFTTSYLMEKNELNGIICYVRPRKSIAVKAIEASPRRTRNDLNFAQKMQVLDLLKQGRTQTEVARRIGCSQSVISFIASKKKEICSQGSNLNPSRKRLRAGKAADMEVALTNWFKSIYTPGKYIPNYIIKEQAELEARKLGNLTFNPSSGWLTRWKLRHNIPSTMVKKKRGETRNKSTNEEEVSQQEVEEEEVAPDDAETEAVSQDDDSRSQNDDSISQRDGTLSHNEDSNSHHTEENGMKQTEVAEKASEKFRSDGIVTKVLPDKGKETSTTSNSVEIPVYPRTHKRNDLSLKDEMRVIELLDQKLSQTKIAKQLGCSQALISRIANSKDEVRAQFLTSENLNRRRNRKGRAPDVDNALWAWYQSLLDQEPGKQISNKMLKDQARKLADEFGISPFSASKGWLNRWKNRYNLVIQPFKKTNTKSHEKNNSTLENLNAETENSITGAVSGLQSVEEEDQDDVSSKLCGENNNTNKQHLSQNVEHSVELLATQPEKDTSGSSTMNIPDSEMNEQVETHPVLGTSEKDTSATSTSNIPGTNSHERDVRATTLDKQLETQKLLATAFLHSLNILGPQTSAQGSSSFSPQLSGSAQEMVQNILELCRAPEQNPPIPTKNQLEEPKPAESFLALSGVNTSMLSPKQSTIVSSVQNCGANETETCDTGLRTPSQTHMLSDSTSLDAVTSSIAHEPCSAITFMPAAVSEISSSFTNTYCIDGTIGTVSSTSSNAPKKQTSTTYGFSTTSKSKSKLKGKSLSNVLEEPVTPRYSTRKRTMNVIVQKLAEEESESDLNDDSDNDPNWEETERKKKSSSGHRNPKKDTDFSSDSDDLMDLEKDEDAFDEDDDYEDEDSAPSMEKPHSDDFKRKIILYAERHGNTKTAIRFHIKEEMVWNWREEKDTLFSVKGSSSNDVLTSRSQGITEEEYVTAAVVEYNKQRIYLGVIEKDKLTYCKTFLGKLDEQFSMSNINANSLILNKKDIQKFSKNEKQFLILSFPCPIKDLKLNINHEKCQYITEEVLRYYQQKKKI